MGALHALSPGRGKGMVVPGRLPRRYPWLNLTSGLLVVSIGGAILWTRLQTARGRRTPLFLRTLERGHSHSHEHGAFTPTVPRTIITTRPQSLASTPDSAPSPSPARSPQAPRQHPSPLRHHGTSATRRTITTTCPTRSHGRAWWGMGASAGLIPCRPRSCCCSAPSPTTRSLGLLSVATFSVGPAATLTALGVAVVHAGRITSRLRIPGAVTATLPALSALVIVVLGLMLSNPSRDVVYNELDREGRGEV